MTNQQPKVDSRHPLLQSLKLLIFLVSLLVLIGVVGYNRQRVWDWWRLRSYTPPPVVAQLATDDTMTPYARRVFYVNNPQIDDKATFVPSCPSGTEQTVVLGCYHSYQDGIYLLQVSDPRLQGIEQVTAAHETLHAIYDRLSSSKRKQVDGWLTDFYQHGLHNQIILDQINSYKQSEPHDMVNEMHSIFGSEVTTLSPQLETYYQQYFTNRAAVAKQYNNYEAAFTDRQNQIKQYDAQLTALKSQIDAAQADLKTRGAALAAEQAQLNNDRSSGQIVAYNSGVPNFNASANAYNAEVAAQSELIDRYNQLVQTRNAIALESQQLTSEITSQPQPLAK